MARLQHVVVAEPAREIPASAKPMRLLRAHGFVNDYGRHRFWAAGEVIDDPEEVALLTKRGAVMETI